MNKSVYISTKPYEPIFGVEKNFVYPEDVGSSFFRNAGSYLSTCTVSHIRSLTIQCMFVVCYEAYFLRHAKLTTSKR